MTHWKALSVTVLRLPIMMSMSLTLTWMTLWFIAASTASLGLQYAIDSLNKVSSLWYCRVVIYSRVRYSIHFSSFRLTISYLLCMWRYRLLLLLLTPNCWIDTSIFQTSIYGLFHLLLTIIIAEERYAMRYPIVIDVVYVVLVQSYSLRLSVLAHYLVLILLLFLILLRLLIKSRVLLLLGLCTFIDVIEDGVLDVSKAESAVEDRSTVLFISLSKTWVLMQLS